MSQKIGEYVNEVGQYTDYEFYIENVDGKDWKAVFFHDSEDNSLTIPLYYIAPAGGVEPYEETMEKAPDALIEAVGRAKAKLYFNQ